jgi:hypothetical protein
MATVSSEIRPVESQVSARLGLLGYLVALLAIVVGWNLNRASHLVNPEEGLGYWLGIVGASMMGILLLYPIRKRVRWLRFLGTTAHWFRVHIFFGVLGPVLILYHCNFGSASMNATVALAFTLFVAGSGIVGRYLHAKIYSDLDGHKRSLREMTERARLRAEDDGSRSAILVPQLLARMQAFDGMVMTPPESFLAILLQPLKVSVLTRLEAVNLRWYTAKQLRLLARKSVTIALERKKLKRATNRFVGEHLRRVRRIAAFSSCERLFSLWHVFHLPFFYMLIVTALLHVLAVHMY